MLRSLRNQLQFLRQYYEQFETTGAIAPSSRFLARSMTRFLAARERQHAVQVLEIGPGTGAVTDQIVRLLGPDDRLDLVELNDQFIRILEERFASDPVWAKVRSQVQIHQQPVQEYSGPAGDFVISGLPLNNFPLALVQEIRQTYLRLVRSGGVLSYFEYMYIRTVRRRISRGSDRTRIIGIDELLGELCERHRICRDSVWLNLPPAWVQHLRLPGIVTDEQTGNGPADTAGSDQERPDASG